MTPRIVNPANLITLTKLLGVPASIMLSPRNSGLAFVVFLTLFWFCDWLDGTIARRLGVCTPFGAAFDLATDRISDLICAAVLLVRGSHETVLLVAAFLIVRFGFEPLVFMRVRLPELLHDQLPRTRNRERVVRITLEIVSLGKACFFGLQIFDPLPPSALADVALALSRSWLAAITAGYFVFVLATLSRPIDSNV
jgi:phosphatidylglycerophosphate synthase